MRSDEALADIPVIMLTSVDQLENGKAFSSLGIQAHLTKPTRSSLLLETLINILQDLGTGKSRHANEIEAAKAVASLQPASDSQTTPTKPVIHDNSAPSKYPWVTLQKHIRRILTL